MTGNEDAIEAKHRNGSVFAAGEDKKAALSRSKLVWQPATSFFDPIVELMMIARVRPPYQAQAQPAKYGRN